MSVVFSVGKSVIEIIMGLTIERITLLSIFVTLMIFVWGKRSEVKFKKQELRRVEYTKFINMLNKVYNNNFKQSSKTKDEFFDTGVSLLIYGSKKVYKKYVFFREYATNPIIQKSKYKDDSIGIYIIADILKTIRHEVGMANFGELESNEVLSFFVNDIGINPVALSKSYKEKNNIRMLKIELFMVNRCKFVLSKKIYYYFIAPVIGTIVMIYKYIFLISLGRLLKVICPKYTRRIQEENAKNVSN